jgi:hypothetical protein
MMAGNVRLRGKRPLPAAKRLRLRAGSSLASSKEGDGSLQPLARRPSAMSLAGSLQSIGV